LGDALDVDVGSPHDRADAEFLAALNGALECRRHLQRHRDAGGHGDIAGRVAALANGRSTPSGDLTAGDDAWGIETTAVIYLGNALAGRYPKAAPDTAFVRELLGQALESYVDGLILQQAGRQAAASALHRSGFTAILKLHGS